MHGSCVAGTVREEDRTTTLAGVQSGLAVFDRRMKGSDSQRNRFSNMPSSHPSPTENPCDGPIEASAGRKLAEKASPESEARFRAIFELAAVGVALVAKDGAWLDVNQRLCDIVGYTREELLGLTFQDITHPGDLDADLGYVRQMLAGEISTYAMEKRYVRKGGGIVWINLTVSLVREASGAPKYFISVVENITERKRAEEALRESEARLRMAVKAANIGLWDWDLQTNAVYFSPEWKSQIGYSNDELSNRFEEWQSRVHPEDLDPVLRKLAAYLDNPQSPHEVELRLRHKDGSYRWIYGQGDLLRDAAGKPVRMLGCHIDITERKRTEDELHRLSQRLLQAEDGERRRIAKELHDSTAQDLVAVTMNLGALRESFAPGDTKAARIIEDSIALLENSVYDIRTLSYVLHPPRLDEAGLAGALAEYAAGFTTRSDTRIRVEVAPDFGRLPEAVEIVLFRVVQEGIANVLRHAGSDTATIRLACAEGNVVLEIEDYGHGMADAGARGVGIAGMRERLQHLGGRLEVESDRSGTIVRAVLPLRENRK